MRHLILCCDGTWQTTGSRSNVARLADAVAPTTEDGTPQVVEYIAGVGTALGTRILGGITGWGLSRNVIAAYTWLAREYRPGDAVWLFGFSRGAYTARSLAGMIGSCGLLDGNETPGRRLRQEVARVYECYRAGSTPDPRSTDRLRFHYRPDVDGTPIRFVGVWDTVGALGIPTHLGPGLIDPFRRRYEFHDVRLDPRIPHARHAVAIDEMRGPFSPTLWRGGDIAAAFCFAVLIAAVAHPATGIGEALGVAPLRWIGERSYGIYLWHLPIILLLRPGVDGLAVGASVIRQEVFV